MTFTAPTVKRGSFKPLSLSLIRDHVSKLLCKAFSISQNKKDIKTLHTSAELGFPTNNLRVTENKGGVSQAPQTSRAAEDDEFGEVIRDNYKINGLEVTDEEDINNFKNNLLNIAVLEEETANEAQPQTSPAATANGVAEETKPNDEFTKVVNKIENPDKNPILNGLQVTDEEDKSNFKNNLPNTAVLEETANEAQPQTSPAATAANGAATATANGAATAATANGAAAAPLAQTPAPATANGLHLDGKNPEFMKYGIVAPTAVVRSNITINGFPAVIINDMGDNTYYTQKNGNLPVYKLFQSLNDKEFETLIEKKVIKRAAAVASAFPAAETAAAFRPTAAPLAQTPARTARTAAAPAIKDLQTLTLPTILEKSEEEEAAAARVEVEKKEERSDSSDTSSNPSSSEIPSPVNLFTGLENGSGPVSKAIKDPDKKDFFTEFAKQEMRRTKNI